MPQIFFDNFDNETIGQSPSNWEVNYPSNAIVVADPAPEYPNDLALYIFASNNKTVIASRFFEPQTEIVELSFNFYVAQVTNPTGTNYKFCDIAILKPVSGGGLARALSMGLIHASGRVQQIVLYPAENKRIVLGSWSFATWHKLKLRFIYTGIFNWVEIFVNDQSVPYSFGQDFGSICKISFTLKSQTYLGQLHSCGILIDDVECTQKAYEMPAEYLCPATKFSVVFPIEPVSTSATFYDGGIPLIPYNWQTGFEPTNVNHPHLGKEWRSKLVNPRSTSGSTIAKHLLSFDLGSAQTVEAVGILNHNLADYLISPLEPPRDFFLVATNDKDKPFDKWDYYFNLNPLALFGLYLRAFVGESNAPLGLTNILIFPNKTYRYWGIYIRQYNPVDDSGARQTTSLGYFKIGRVVLGAIGESTYNFSDDWGVEIVDPSRVFDNLANARWARALNPYRKIRMSFNLNDSDGEQVAYFFGVLRKEPYIYIVVPERVNREIEKTSWVYARVSNDSFELSYIFKDYADFEVELIEEVW